MSMFESFKEATGLGAAVAGPATPAQSNPAAPAAPAPATPANSAAQPAPASSSTPEPAAAQPAPAQTSQPAPAAPTPAPAPKKPEPPKVPRLVQYVCNKECISKDVIDALSGDEPKSELVSLLAYLQHPLKMSYDGTAPSVTDAEIVRATRYAANPDSLSNDFAAALENRTANQALTSLARVMLSCNPELLKRLKSTPSYGDRDHISLLFYGTKKDKWYETDKLRKDDGNTDTSDAKFIWVSTDGRNAGLASPEDIAAALKELVKLRKAAQQPPTP